MGQSANNGGIWEEGAEDTIQFRGKSNIWGKGREGEKREHKIKSQKKIYHNTFFFPLSNNKVS